MKGAVMVATLFAVMMTTSLCTANQRAYKGGDAYVLVEYTI